MNHAEALPIPFCCMASNRLYRPFSAIKSSCVPCSTMPFFSLSRTKIQSAFLIVDSRWAMMIVVRPSRALSSASCASWINVSVETEISDISVDQRLRGPSAIVE